MELTSLRILSNYEKSKIQEALKKQGTFFVVGGSISTFADETTCMNVALNPNLSTLSNDGVQKIKKTIKEIFTYVDEVEVI